LTETGCMQENLDTNLWRLDCQSSLLGLLPSYWKPIPIPMLFHAQYPPIYSPILGILHTLITN